MKFTNRPDERYEIRLSGTGGQGIITAGMIIGEACAFYAGLNTCMTQSYGPEARGGACRAELVISEEEVDAPKVNRADMLLAMSQQAYDKFKDDVKEWGIVIVDSSLVNYDDAPNVFPFPFSSIARQKVGFAVTANIVAVGFIAGITGIANRETMRKVVARKVPPGTEKTNFKALDFGFEAAQEPVAEAGIKVDQYITDEIVTVGRDTLIKDAMNKAIEAEIEAVIVVDDENRIEGIFTFFDCVRAVAKGYHAGETTVGELMITDVLTSSPGEKLGRMLMRMADHRYKNIPVIDDGKTLLGVLSSYDVQDTTRDEMDLKDAVDFIDATRTLITGGRWSSLKSVSRTALKVSPDETVDHVAKKMVQRKVDDAIVVDENEMPLGIFTEKDLCKRVVSRGLLPENTKIKKVMSKRLTALDQTDNLTNAFNKMVQSNIHHMPLLNRNGRVVGSVSYADIAKVIHSRFYLYETMTSDQIPTLDD
ncbi:MAG: CBS domain-containing protein [Planctomycetota bacterium]|nr:CBS domain-containing protein [Planctomycetota bacterium]